MNRLQEVAEAATRFGLDIADAQAEQRESEAGPDRSSVVVVALPTITTNLPRGGNDDPEPLHCTIRYFPDADPAALPSLTELLTHLAETVGPFTADVAGRGRLGPNSAAVLLVEAEAIQDFHDLLDGAMPGGEDEKWPHFVPHITLAYGDDIDLEAMDPAEFPAAVTFDRIGLWVGEDHSVELDLIGTDEMGEAVDDDEHDDDAGSEKSLLLAAAFDAEVGAVVAGGASMPVVDSTDDLPAAIEHAKQHPDTRWYVEARARALTAGMAMPWDEENDGDPDEAVERACEVMHDAYEQAAAGAGWETNPESRKPWAEVPDANKAAMRAAVTALFAWLAEDDEDDDPDGEPEPELRGPGGVQAAGARYVRMRSLGQPVADDLYDTLMADAGEMGMLADPIVLSAKAWHDREVPA